MKHDWRNAVRYAIVMAFFVCVLIGGTSVCKADIVYGTFNLDTDWQSVTVSADPAFYSFSVPQDGLVDFGFQSFVNDVYFQVLNYDLTDSITKQEVYYASETSPKTIDCSLALSAGNYCIKIYPYSSSNSKNFGTVRVKATYMSYNSTELESNDSFMTANALVSKTPITGTITENNQSDDFYLFNVPASGQVSINFLSMIKEIRYTFYTADFTQLDTSTIYYGYETSPKTFTYTGSFEAGNYYLKVSHYSGTGRYTLTYMNSSVTSVSMKKSVSLNVNETYSLNPVVEPADAVNQTLNYVSSDVTIASVDSNGTIKANKAGVATITATTTDGSNVSAKTKVVVVPAQVTGIRATKTTGNKITLEWNSLDGVDGYRVYLYDSSKKKYVTYKNVTANSVTIKGLKSEKKYKVKIAAYVKNGSKSKLGKKSATYSTYTAPKKLGAPKISSVKVTSSTYSGKYLTVKWSKVSGSSGYIVYTKYGSGSWTKYTTTDSTSAQIYANKGYTYSIKVVPYRMKNGLTTNGKASKVFKKEV